MTPEEQYGEALRRQSSARTRQGVLEKQYEEANRLRGLQHTPNYPGMNGLGASGIGAAMGAFGVEMEKSRGHRDAARLEKAMLANQGMDEGANFGLVQSMKRQREQDERALKDSDRKYALEYRKMANQQAQDNKRDDSLHTYEDANGKKHTISFDGQNRPIFAGTGEPVTDMGGWKKVSDRSSVRTPSEKNITMMREGHTQLKKMIELNDTFEPRFAQPAMWSEAQGGGAMTKIANKVFGDLAGEDLLQFVDEETDVETKRALQWWADFKMSYELVQRHKFFGATLTKNEQEAWDSALQMKMGNDPNEVAKRLATLGQIMDKSYKHMLDVNYVRGEGYEAPTAINARGLYERMDTDDGYGEYNSGRTWEPKLTDRSMRDVPTAANAINSGVEAVQEGVPVAIEVGKNAGKRALEQVKKLGEAPKPPEAGLPNYMQSLYND